MPFVLQREAADFLADEEGCGTAEERCADGNVVQAEDRADGERGDAAELDDVAERSAADGSRAGAGGCRCSHDASVEGFVDSTATVESAAADAVAVISIAGDGFALVSAGAGRGGRETM